jgi:hypothetical protein
MFPAVFARVTGLVLQGEPAVLDGYACCAVIGKVYPVAVRKSRAHIRGLLYRNVDQIALSRLDQYEGSLYVRKRVVVRRVSEQDSQTGYYRRAWVYEIAAPYRNRVSNRRWSAQEFSARHLADYLEEL